MTKLPNKTKIIGENIRNIRLFKKIKAKEVAAHCGISAGHYQMLESGRRRINIEHIFAIAEALGVPPEKLINPDITTYSPSGRALPLVKIEALNAFSTCPDKDSVEKIANQICLCPPEVTDERAFAVRVEYDWGTLSDEGPLRHFEISRIIICVPSKAEEVLYAEDPEATYQRRDRPLGPADIPPHSPLVKIANHPVYYTSAYKWQHTEGLFISLFSFTKERGFETLTARARRIERPPGVAKSGPDRLAYLEWICRTIGFYPGQLFRFVTARKRPRKEE